MKKESVSNETVSVKPRQKSFYFTYGSSKKMPFQGGWSIVKAEDKQAAFDKFIKKHPLTKDGYLNCSSIYDSVGFRKTVMYKDKSSLGAGLHETIK